jgi:hypothetical protein
MFYALAAALGWAYFAPSRTHSFLRALPALAVAAWMYHGNKPVDSGIDWTEE